MGNYLRSLWLFLKQGFGLGSFGGFVFQLQDRRSSNLDNLVQAMGQVLGTANQTTGLQRVFSTFQANTPQLLIEINRNRAKALRVSIDNIFGTLQTALGSEYVNDFNLQQRTYRVYLQADKQFRSAPEDINKLYVRSGLRLRQRLERKLLIIIIFFVQ
ncbi:MAG: hypothetical protein RLZZ148_3123 [Cyanobacteriota bacterium]